MAKLLSPCDDECRQILAMFGLADSHVTSFQLTIKYGELPTIVIERYVNMDTLVIGAPETFNLQPCTKGNQ